MSAQGPPDVVVLARLRRPWGRRGEVLVDSCTDWPELRFAPGRAVRIVWDDGRALEQRVRAYRELGGRRLLAFEGVDGIGAARDLSGGWIVAEPDALERLEPDAVRHADVIGLQVVDVAGHVIGWVAGIDEGSHADLLRVTRVGGGEFLTPTAPAICVRIDLQARTLVLDPPQGLLDPEAAEQVAPRPARRTRAGDR